MRRAVRLIGWLGLACIVGLAGVVAGVYLTHPRDSDGYVDYVLAAGDYDGQELPASTSTEPLVDAGERACDWLSHQPPALWRTDVERRVNSLFTAYRSDMTAADKALPRSVVPGAWEYLCPAAKVLVKPHYVFSDPGD